MKNDTPHITVIVAVYNGVSTLKQCLDSIVNQSYKSVQLIVIDGGSTDGSVDIIREMSGDIYYWISEPDKGIYNAWNKGLAKATGDWVCFIGSDDYFVNVKVLENMALALMQVPLVINVVYGKIVLLGYQDEVLYEFGEPWGRVASKFKKTMCLPHPGLMHRRTAFLQYGEFDESFKIAADYDMLLRFLRDGVAQFVPNLTVVAMRQGGASSNPANTLLALSEVRDAQYKAGFILPSMTWMFAWFRALLRLIVWRIFGERNARRILDLGRHMMGLRPYWTKTK